MNNIVLTGGGTAGHCTPNIALLPYLKKDFSNIYYIGSKNGIEKTIVSKYNIPYFDVPCIKLKRNLSLDNIKIPFVLIKGISKSIKLLKKLDINIIFSKGGYVALPTVIAGKILKIPVISHESDYSIGLANKIASKFSSLSITSFPDTAKTIKNAVYVGSPIRQDIILKNKKICLDFFNFPIKKPILLVMGGSLGAKPINDAIFNCIDKLTTNFNVIHIVGKGNLNKSIKNSSYYQVEFMSNINYAITICDIAVIRGGANSLFEMLKCKIPCVVIPLPKGASRGDQIENALYFQKTGSIIVLPQNAVTNDSLLLSINSAYANRNTIINNLNNNPISDKSFEIAKMLFSYHK